VRPLPLVIYIRVIGNKEDLRASAIAEFVVAYLEVNNNAAAFG
jgi:hypothetical protein